MRWLVVTGVLGAALAALGLMSGDVDPFKILQIALGILLVAYSMVMRRKMPAADHVAKSLTRYVSPGPPPERNGMSSSARSVSLRAIGGLGFAAAMGIMFIAVGIYVEPSAVNAAWTIAVAMGVGFLAMTGFVATRVTNEIHLSSGGIHVHHPRMNFTVNFARDNIEEAAVSGRVLRVTLRDAPFGMARRSRHFIRGDVRERAEFSQALVLYGLERRSVD